MKSDPDSLEMIRQTVQDYFDGLYHSDVETLKKVFHVNAQVVGFYKGNPVFQSLEGFLEIVEGTPAPFEKGEEYDMKIVSIEVTGDEAIAKVADLYLGLRFTDYLSLLKINGEWVIVNKMFNHE